MGRLRFTQRKRKQTQNQNQNQNPKKWTKEACAQQINAMVNKYECLTKVLTQCVKEQLIRSLYNGYRLSNSPTRYARGLRIFTLEDLKDRDSISVAKYAIREHNKNVEDNAKLALEELIYIYTVADLHGLQYTCYFVARKLSDDELKGYWAVIRTTYSDGKKVLKVFNPLGQRIGEDSSEEDKSIAGNSYSSGTPERSFGNASKEESGSSCEKEKQTDSFTRKKSDSISVSFAVAEAME